MSLSTIFQLYCGGQTVVTITNLHTIINKHAKFSGIIFRNVGVAHTQTATQTGRLDENNMFTQEGISNDFKLYKIGWLEVRSFSSVQDSRVP